MSFTAAVPTTGDRVNLTFSASQASVDYTKFSVSASGRVIALLAAMGSGTAWSLPIDLRSGWIESGASVSVTSILDNSNTTAVNSSITTSRQKTYVTDKGLGIFVHLSSSSFGFPDPLTLANVQSINLPSYNMDQWFTSVIVPSGARYAVFTTKHAGGLSWWPTAAGNWNIAQTAFGVAHPGADLVRDWVGLCRKYNIGVGLYINPVYDPWFLNNSPGHDGTYHNPAFTTYVTQHLTELLSNYGQIDLLWLDIGGSYNAAWSDMAAVRNSLQPNCQLVNNSHEFNLVNGDIVEYEGSGRGDVPPTAGNSVPSEFCEDSRTNNAWVWTGIPSDDVYHDIWYVVNNIISLRAARTSYLLNFPITTGGVQAASSGTFASQIGAYMGKRGGAVLPAVINVTAALDRGDGTLGTRGSGINGSNILGLP